MYFSRHKAAIMVEAGDDPNRARYEALDHDVAGGVTVTLVLVTIVE